MKNLKENARYLRNNMADQERKFWQIIKNRQFYGFRFLRQCVIGNYIADFICREKKIIIELDGSQHNEQKNIMYDNQRTEYLINKGYKVIRFWNNDIDNNLDGVYLQLKKEFEIYD